MHSELEKFETDWVGIAFALSNKEMDILIKQLNALRTGEIDHFHFCCTKDEGIAGVADVEFSVKGIDDMDNMAVG